MRVTHAIGTKIKTGVMLTNDMCVCRKPSPEGGLLARTA
jgi:hypothetical protein